MRATLAALPCTRGSFFEGTSLLTSGDVNISDPSRCLDQIYMGTYCIWAILLVFHHVPNSMMVTIKSMDGVS